MDELLTIVDKWRSNTMNAVENLREEFGRLKLFIYEMNHSRLLDTELLLNKLDRILADKGSEITQSSEVEISNKEILYFKSELVELREMLRTAIGEKDIKKIVSISTALTNLTKAGLYIDRQCNQF